MGQIISITVEGKVTVALNDSDLILTESCASSCSLSFNLCLSAFLTMCNEFTMSKTLI